ncbi:MAG: hypothetical protein HWN68_03050 [Desulfobacterales bacterium]|nr:hypothetical protein [Desulfobacterales bacterium]
MAELTMFRPCKMLLILILLITCSGCSTRYVPQPYPIKPEMVPNLSAAQAVAIVNVQTDTKFKVPIGPDGHMKGNLREWTDTAVEVLKTELKKNDITISEDAPKVLKLSVTKVYMFCGTMWNARCILYLKVETGDGYAKEFEGNNFSLEGFKGASPFAVTKAVAAMLNNDKILSYLKK